MNIKERILSIKLINRNMTHPDFLNEIGVTTATVVKEEKNSKMLNEKGEHNYVMEITD